MKITKGTWEIGLYGSRKDGAFTVGPIGYVDGIARTCTTAPPDEQEANAKLIAEAGTVANETGFTPRQLLRQRDALLAACEDLRGEQKRCNQLTPKMCDAMQACDDAIALTM